MTHRFRLAAARSVLAASAVALMSSAAFADNLSMWVRASGADAAQHMVDLWNSSHDDQIEITVIPDNQMVTKLATGSQAGDVPDILSFDLIYMPDFMNAGFLKDITARCRQTPTMQGIAQAYKDLGTWEGKIYGAGFTPDVSVLLWNKDLFSKAGLDPDKAPTTLAEIHEDAKKISALGDDIYGYYFSGACPGCNIFVTSPMMVAAGSQILPAKPGDKALTGDGVKDVLTEMHAMWQEGLIPESAQADTGSNFFSTFETGKIGIQGTGGFAISALKHDKPDMDFGIGLPAGHQGWAGQRLRRRRCDCHSGGVPAPRQGSGVHQVGADRRGAARGAGQEQHHSLTPRSRGQQVFYRSARGDHGHGRRAWAMCRGAALQRHGKLRFQPVDSDDPVRDLRRQHRRRHPVGA